MTIKEAAQKWGISEKTVLYHITLGHVKGAQKIIADGVKRYDIPPDAERPLNQPAGRKKKQPPTLLPPEPLPPLVPLTLQEIEGHLRRFATSHTYKQLQQELGISREEIREIYDRLHAKYGI